MDGCVHPSLSYDSNSINSVNRETLWDEQEQALEELLPTVLKLASHHVRYSRICSPCERNLGEKVGRIFTQSVLVSVCGVIRPPTSPGMTRSTVLVCTS